MKDFPPESKVAVLESQQDEFQGFLSPVVLKAGLYFFGGGPWVST